MYQYFGSADILLYDILNLISSVFLLAFNLTQIKKKRLILSNTSLLLTEHFQNKKKIRLLSSIGFRTVIEIVIISLAQYGPAPNLNDKFGEIVGTGDNYFGTLFFIPFILLIVYYIIGVDPLKQTDLITPAYPLALAVVKLACFCQGCCNGIECSFGLYNHDTGLVEFPVQLVESGLALLIFIFLLLWRKKAKDGTLFPTYLIMYSATRFFSEFLRSEPDVIWKLKTYHILCIIGVIAGIVELIIVLKFGNKISLFYSERKLSFKWISSIFDEIKFRYTVIKKRMTKKDHVTVHHGKRNKKKRK